MGIDMQVEGKTTELFMVDSSVQIHLVTFHIHQMNVGEEDSRGIHDDGVMGDGVPCSGPW